MNSVFKKVRFIVNIILIVIMVNVNAYAAVTKPSRLLIAGDSISHGYGLKGSEKTSKSYGNLLAKAFNLNSSSYTNISVDGASSSNILTKVSESRNIISNSDTIILSIGGNDILELFLSDIKNSLELPDNPTPEQVRETVRNPQVISAASMKFIKGNGMQKYFTAVSKFEINLKKVVGVIKAYNPSAKLYVQTIYNPFSGNSEMSKVSSIAEIAIGKMNNVIMSNSSSQNYKVINVYAAFSGKGDTLTNIKNFDVHPNEAGHNVIFEEAYKAMTDVNYTQNKSNVTNAYENSIYEKVYFMFENKTIIIALAIAVILITILIIKMLKSKNKINRIKRIK